MAAAAVPLLDGHLKTGILSVPLGSCRNLTEQLQKKNIEVIEGAKDNLPDEQSMVAATKIKKLVSNLGSNDILLVLVSGNIYRSSFLNNMPSN
jgi:glycerate 2-kinase